MRKTIPANAWSARILTQGRACPLCLSSSDVGLFGDSESVIYLDAEIPHGALDFGVAQQKLDRPEVAGALVDQRGLGPAQRVRAVERGIETDLVQPAIQQPRIGGCSYAAQFHRGRGTDILRGAAPLP